MKNKSKRDMVMVNQRFKRIVPTFLLASQLGLSASVLASQSINYHYNAQGLVDEIDGPRTDVDDTTTLSYDAETNLASLTNALGQSWQYSGYNELGLPGSITDPNGVTTTLSYDGQGRLTGLSRAGQSWSYSYDALGQLTGSTNPAGQTITRTYGDDHRLSQISYPDGTTRDLTYDAMGNVIAQKESGNGLNIDTGYEYDELGRVLSVVNGDGVTIAAYGYDTNSNVTSTRNANPVSRTLQYDALNRLVTETDELGYSHTTQYNSHDAVTQYTDSNSASTTYTRNGLDQITQRVSPDTGTTNYTYDDAGNLTGLTLADGTTVNRHYDALNRLTQISLPDSSTSFHYDEGSQGVGHLTSATSGNVTQNWQYNESGQLLSQSQQQTLLQPKTGQSQTLTDTVSYSYDGQGQLSDITYPQGLSLHYSYNNAGQIDSISSTQGSASRTLVSDGSYTTGGRLSALTYGNGLTLNQTYNNQGQLSAQTLSSLWSRSYSYDSNGQLSAQSENNQTTTEYGWDLLQRLTKEQGSNQNWEYQYDAVGNRLKTLLNGSNNKQYSYITASNRQSVVNSMPVSFNALGQPDKADWRPLKWRTDGSLTSATYESSSPAQTLQLSYGYNALQQRVVKTKVVIQASGKTTQVNRYTYSPSGQLLYWAWQRSDGQYGAQSYVWMGNQPVAFLKEENGYQRWTYIHSDQLNTPVLGTNNNQQIVWRWSHDAYGVGSTDVDSDKDGVPTDIVLRYPGQDSDDDVGLYYNWHRYYNPNTGRYISSDPIGLAGGENTYAYVGNDPLGSVDPDGLMAIPYPFIPPVVPGSNGQNPSRPDYPGIQGLPAYPGMSIPDSLGDTNESPIPSEATPWSTTRPMRDLGREWLNQNACDSTQKAKDLGYGKRIPPQKAPFNSHGQPVFTNGKNYISPDVDGHSQDDGWKMFDRRGDRTGTWNSDLSERIKD